MKEKIMERINAYKNGENEDALERNDILSGILKNTSKLRKMHFFMFHGFKSLFSEDELFDIESMIDNFLMLFVAGQETTGNALAFSFLELAKNPRVFDL